MHIFDFRSRLMRHCSLIEIFVIMVALLECSSQKWPRESFISSTWSTFRSNSCYGRQQILQCACRRPTRNQVAVRIHNRIAVSIRRSSTAASEAPGASPQQTPTSQLPQPYLAWQDNCRTCAGAFSTRFWKHLQLVARRLRFVILATRIEIL
jgi:hypothetical protein